MTNSQGEKAIARLFSTPLTAHGFSCTESGVFCRRLSDDVSHRLAIGGRTASDRTFQFTVWVGVRFISLERLLRPDMDSPTIVMPIHLLRADHHFTEWSLCDDDDDVAVADEVLSDISHYAFPFFAANSTLALVAERLRSESPRDWYILDPLGRLRMLIAIEFLHGDRAAAVQRLDAIIAERRSALPKHRVPFVALRRRFDEIQAT
jgi:hypothetical protein